MPHEYQNTGVSLVPDTGVSSTDLLTNENTPTFQGTAAAGSTVEVFADGTSIGSSGSTTSGSWSITATSPLADGEHVITYEVTDSDGTTTQSTDSLTITIDTVDPGFTDGAAATRTTEENIGSDQIIYTANATDSSGVTYRLKDGLADDAHRFTIFSNNGDVALNENPDHETQDVYNFTVVATDDAGNESEQAVTLNVTDQSIPKPSIISTQDPEQDGITNSSTPTFQGKADPNSSVQVLIGDSTVLGTTTADSSGNWELTPSDYSGSAFSTDGDYSITYQFTKDGAVSDPSDPLTVTIDTASPIFYEGAIHTRTIEENSGSNQVVYEAKTRQQMPRRLHTG